MPVYNGEKYLSKAIKSILRQTFANFEFLIILEPSTDRSEQIINSFSDSRIILIKNEKKMGLSPILNQGLRMAKGEYIARMDCDDISHHDRLLQQVRFMDQHPDVGICGSWCFYLSKNPKTSQLRYWKTILLDYLGFNFSTLFCPPSNYEKIRCWMLFMNPIAHPTVIMRNEFLKKFNLHYDTTYRFAEDYEFWTKTVDKFKCSNLKKILLYYRLHSEQFDRIHQQNQDDTSSQIRMNLIQKLRIEPSQREKQIHDKLCEISSKKDEKFLNLAHLWLQKLRNANHKIKYFNETRFSQVLVEKWFELCINSCCSKFWIWKIFWGSSLQPLQNLRLLKKLLFCYIWFNSFFRKSLSIVK